MELNINVATSDNCKVTIQDTSTYLAEDFSGTVKGKFKYSETVSIDLLRHNKTTETVYRDPIYTKHSTSLPISIPIEFDGWFDVIHLVLPSTEWFNREVLKEEGSAIGLYNLVYFSDGITIYKYIGGNIYQVTIDEVLEVNDIDTTISKTNREYVSICFLRKCYINLCLQIFNKRGFSPCNSVSSIDNDLIYKRDLVWMSINVIEYLTLCKLLAEVERIIETIQGCNGLCVSSDTTSKTNGCGCSK